MAHLGEQAITGERQHDHAERLRDAASAAHLSDLELADRLGQLADRLFVEGHRNEQAIREAARRLEAR